VRYESVGNVQCLGKVNHPRADTHVVRDDDNTARTANTLTHVVRCYWSTYRVVSSEIPDISLGKFPEI